MPLSPWQRAFIITNVSEFIFSILGHLAEMLAYVRIEVTLAVGEMSGEASKQRPMKGTNSPIG